MSYETKKLADIASIQTGYAFRSKIEQDFDSSIKVIQMKDIDAHNQIDFSDVYTVEIEDISEQHLLKPGDILLKSRGVTWNATTEAALVPENIGQAVASHLTVIRVKSVKVDPAYLVWYLNQPQTQHQFKRLAVGTSMRMISNADLKSLSVIVPPIERQRLIAEVAKLSQQEQQLLEKITEKRKAYINAVLIQQVKQEEEV